MKRLALFVLGFATMIIVGNPGAPQANARRAANTVTVEPASLNFDMSGSADTKVSMVTIHNDYNTAVNLSAQFKGIDETGGKIIPFGQPSQVILDTLKLAATEFSVPPHGVYFLSVLATNSGSLPAGGHYGTLVLSDNTSPAGQSSVQPKLSLGIFIVNRDGLVNKIELTKHVLSRKYLGFPDSLSIELLNDGNAHAVPRASVRVIDRKGTIVAEGIFNQDSKVILPNRRFDQQLSIQRTKSSYLPQKLTLEIRYRADGIDEPVMYQEHFWYVPTPYIGLPIGVLLLVIFLLRKKWHKKVMKNQPKNHQKNR